MKICRFTQDNSCWQWGEILGPSIQELFLVNEDPVSFSRGPRAYSVDECKFLIPCEPSRLIGIGDNYPREDAAYLLHPVIFDKPLSSLTSNKSKVFLPENLKVWGEPEIGVVIKKSCSDLVDFELEDYVLGYCLINDTTAEFSSPNYDSHSAEAKGLSGFCQIGDFINTNFDYSKALIVGEVNGEIYRQGQISSMKWDLRKILKEVTATRTLKPFDIIFTGTPGRVKKERSFLKDNDEFLVRSNDLGELKTVFKANHER